MAPAAAASTCSTSPAPSASAPDWSRAAAWCAAPAGFAGEVGHLPIGERGARCGCGRLGCWEATIGLHAVLARVGLAELDTPESTARAVADVAAHDPGVRASLEDVGEHLGRGLAILAGVLDPGVIVLGGYFGPLADVVLAPARAVLAASLAAPVQEPPDLRPGELGTESAALGAAERALEEVYDGQAELTGSSRPAGRGRR